MPKTSESSAPERAKVDRILGDAVDQARAALAPIAHDDEIGAHLGAVETERRLVCHTFDCLKKGYRGWRWMTTLARSPRSRKATVCEIGLVPGPDALLAPEWVPWEERLEPGDIGRGDTLPYRADDARLDHSYEDADAEELDERTVEEMGLGRPRILSSRGRREAADRWYASECGPARGANNRRKLPEHTCADCGFMVKLSGSLRRAFGVCANEWSPDDGRVVSLDHTCGAHSETDIAQQPSPWEPEPPRQ
ncbi:DUF3027 domain-containing protein [Nanchangia anserum]|uniref:DUF3027 domain-containing protein n=1 Tax=Nanchangia anserum TaxID=2692125 RepID=UPI001884870B|nr:DUF3027 domain-containing protein [Nanchangia anserum]QOX82189.1 DUF3027 domain-containing protein [Nanchangia anserum]